MQIKIKHSLTTPLLILIMYILLAASNYLDSSALQKTDNVFLAVIIMQIIIFIIPGILYCKFRGSSLTPHLRLKPFGVSKLLLAISAFFVLVFGSSIIKLALYSIGGYNANASMYQNYIPNSIQGFGNVLYIIVAIALIPAITEEFIFRGIVLGEYTAMGCNKITAVACSALLFAMMHFNIQQLPVYFFGGIVTAYVALVTDSVLCAMLTHLLNNGFSLLFEQQLLRLISTSDSMIFILFILSVLMLIFLILCFQATERIYYVKGINGERSPAISKKKKKNKKKMDINLEAIISPSFILCVIAFIVVTFILK